jgi:hypothetical protein
MLASAGSGLGYFAGGVGMLASTTVGAMGDIYRMIVQAGMEIRQSTPEDNSQIDTESVSEGMRSFSDFSDTSLTGDNEEE